MDAFEKMKITRRELIAVHSNGIVLNCQGMFVGQLLVKTSRQANSLVVLQLALVPDLGFITAAINELVKSNFCQCMTPLYLFFFLLFFLFTFAPLDFLFLLNIFEYLALLTLMIDEGFKEEVLCPGCVEKFLLNHEKIGTITEGDKVHSNHFLDASSIPFSCFSTRFFHNIIYF